MEAVEAQRREYVALFGDAAGNALLEQEYFCSFSAVTPGAYYAKEMTEAERDRRITKVDRDFDLPVHTAWDLGIDDSTAIWCFQVQPGRLHVIDYYEASGHGAEHYCGWLNQQGYRGIDWVPHDARVREWGTGRSRLATLNALGRKPRIVPENTLMDGINAARLTIPLTHFDAARCARGLECLRSYQAEWDENLRTFKKTPKHDWASHGADAWRYLAASWREPMDLTEESPQQKLARQIAEMIKPRTFADVINEFEQELAEAE